MEKTLNNKDGDKGGIAGVSLIEIMISLVLVSLALMAITSTFPSINKNRKGIQEAEQAKVLAAQVLEGLQFLTDAGVCPACAADDKICAAYREDCVTFRTRYRNNDGTPAKVKVGIVEYEVEDWETKVKPTSWGKTVDVTVKWRKGGKEHKVTVTGAI